MPVVMGRKTYESMAAEPLPGRINIVITRQSDFNPNKSDVAVVNNLNSAIEKAKETDCKEVFVAGGGEIYKESISIADKIYMTRVHASFPDADAFFPTIDENKWKLSSREDFPSDDKHAYAYSFEVWLKK